MTLIRKDGGGLYFNTITDKFDAVVTTSGVEPTVDTGTNGRWGGRCIQMGNLNASFGLPPSAALGWTVPAADTYVVQFAVNVSTGSGSSDMLLCAFYEGATLHTDIRLNPSGNVFKWARGGTAVTTSANNLWSTTGGWKYVQLKVKVHDTTGTIEFIYGGLSVFSLTGLDTQNGATGVIDKILIGNAVSPVNGQLWFYRVNDIAVCDTTGSAPMNDIHAEGRIRLLTPNGEGDTNNWTPSTGTDNSLLVDEIPNNGDTDYNASTAVNDIDLYTFTNLPVTPVTIYAVQGCNMVAKDDAGTDDAAAIVKSGGTVYVGTSVTISGVVYQKVTHIWEQDPATAAAWTKTNVDALQAGVKRVA